MGCCCIIAASIYKLKNTCLVNCHNLFSLVHISLSAGGCKRRSSTTQRAGTYPAESTAGWPTSQTCPNAA